MARQRVAELGSEPSLAELIRRRARQLGDRTACVTDTRNWSYRELDEASNRLAQGFSAAGVARDDAIACLTRHGTECILLLLAASKMGAVLAPLNWRLSAAELEYLLGVVRPRVLVADAFLSDTLDRVELADPPLRLVTDADEGGLLGWQQGWPAVDPLHQPQPGDVACLLFSSGTTGNPKGVEITHEGILLHCSLWTESFGYREDTRQLNVLPTFHVSGVVNAVWMLALGAVVVFQSEFVPDRFLEAIEHHAVTDAFAVPAMLRVLLGAPRFGSTDLSSLRSISYGGSPIDPALLLECVQRFGCRMLQVYGMTEATGTLTTLGSELLACATGPASAATSVGRPGPHVEIRVVDPVGGAECGEEELGEVWVRAPHLMRGYLGDARATADAFPAGRGPRSGWLRTGDAGMLRGGFLFLMDRIKDMVISGGENIYPAEVERVLASHAEVADVAVIGVPDERWGETVKACVVARPEARVTEAGLIAFARERLAHYKCPTSIDFLAELPRNPSGKVLKRELRRPYWAGRNRDIA